MSFPAVSRAPELVIAAVRLLRHLVSWLMGGAILCWVAGHSGPETGTAIVHVTEPQVVVSVDGASFQIDERTGDPLVCELPAGNHQLTMKRGEEVLYNETFAIRSGEEQILTAWRRPSKIAEANWRSH